MPRGRLLCAGRIVKRRTPNAAHITEQWICLAEPFLTMLIQNSRTRAKSTAIPEDAYAFYEAKYSSEENQPDYIS